MSKGSARRPGDHNSFSANFDKIFGSKNTAQGNTQQESDSKNSEKHITELSQTLTEVKQNS